MRLQLYIVLRQVALKKRHSRHPPTRGDCYRSEGNKAAFTQDQVPQGTVRHFASFSPQYIAICRTTNATIANGTSHIVHLVIFIYDGRNDAMTRGLYKSYILANMNSRSRSLFAVARPSVCLSVCLSVVCRLYNVRARCALLKRFKFSAIFLRH